MPGLTRVSAPIASKSNTVTCTFLHACGIYIFCPPCGCVTSDAGTLATT